MDEAEICQRVGIIDYGKIVYLDTPGALKNKYNVTSLNEVFLQVTGREFCGCEQDDRLKIASHINFLPQGMLRTVN